MLTELSVLPEYDHIRLRLQELIKENTNEVRRFNFLFIVIIIIDNFDMSQKRNEIHISDKNAHFSATVALINENVNISTIRFLQFMYWLHQSWRISNIIDQSLRTNDVLKMSCVNLCYANIEVVENRFDSFIDLPAVISRINYHWINDRAFADSSLSRSLFISFYIFSAHQFSSYRSFVAYSKHHFSVFVRLFHSSVIKQS